MERTLTQPLRLLALVAALVGLPACGGGGALRGQTYADDQVTYRIGHLGPPWQPIELGSQNDLAWSDGEGGLIQVNARCEDDLDIPLRALTNHLLFGFTEREIESEETRPMDGREALRTHATAKLDGVPRELVLHVLKKDGCVYDFALIADPGAPFGRILPSFERFVSEFHTVGAPR
ncbi:MAG: hypothetical protein KC416_00690 [Myxococcales bacterium]|nr:hypothetical protein [Myxococcales bacterium]